MKRRALLSATIFIVAGCVAPKSISAIAADVALIDSGIQTILAGLAVTGSINPADLARATSLAEQVHAAALTVAADTAGVSTAPLARQIIATVQSLEPIVVRYLPPASGYAVLMTAAISLLPALALAFGAPMAVKPGKAGPTISQEDARTILRRGA